MATVNKDFKIKNGLVVEGSNATVNGNQILTETASDQYIIDLIGGETLITSVDADDFTVTGGNLTIAAGSDIARDGDITTALADYTPTSSLDNTVGGYGYLKSGDLPTMYSDSDVDAHLSGGDGISYSSGTISANVGNGLHISADDIEIDRTVVDQWYDASGAASTAETNANNYTDTQLEDYTPTSSLDTTVGGYGYLKSADLSSYATETYVNTAVDNLVDGAPGLLDTLNEIAAAINDDENYATTMTTALAGKQDELTAGSNIDITGSTISVTGLDSTDISDFNTAALSATSSAYEAYGEVSTHASDTSTHGVGEIVGTSEPQELTSKTISGLNNTISDIDNTSLVNYSIDINGQTTNLGSSVTLDTDDVSEGSTNLYYETARAKTDAAALLTGATLTNITITGDGDGLTITAENGVADSTTDNLTEGSTNLYFTDSRAVSAITNATIYPTAININDYRTEEATQQIVVSASTVTAHTFAGNKSVKYLVRTVGNVTGTLHSQVTELLVTVDGANNVAVTEYGTIYTSENPLSTATMDYSGGEYRLRVTTTISGAEVVAAATIMSWGE